MGRHRQGARRYLEAGSGGVGVAHAALPDRAGEDGAVQQDEGVRRALRDIERAITTHLATQWAKGVQKWRKPAVYPPKPTVDLSFRMFCGAAIGAGEHDGLLAYPVEDHQWASLS